MEIITQSAEETFNLGKEIANHLVGGEVLALVGNLGGGKTTFVQGLAEGLGIKTRIISPTFILMRNYDTKNNKLYHIDIYRLESSIDKELNSLGFKDLIKDDQNIIVVEWADKAKDYFPNETIWIKFEYLKNDSRKITISDNFKI